MPRALHNQNRWPAWSEYLCSKVLKEAQRILQKPKRTILMTTYLSNLLPKSGASKYFGRNGLVDKKWAPTTVTMSSLMSTGALHSFQLGHSSRDPLRATREARARRWCVQIQDPSFRKAQTLRLDIILGMTKARVARTIYKWSTPNPQKLCQDLRRVCDENVVVELELFAWKVILRSTEVTRKDSFRSRNCRGPRARVSSVFRG